MTSTVLQVKVCAARLTLAKLLSGTDCKQLSSCWLHAHDFAQTQRGLPYACLLFLDCSDHLLGAYAFTLARPERANSLHDAVIGIL